MTKTPPLCVNPRCSKPLTRDPRREGQYRVKHGWCEACYSRWRRNGCPEGWPHVPEPRTSAPHIFTEAELEAGRETKRRRRIAKYEDAMWLLETGCSMEEATSRTKISIKSLRDFLRTEINI